MARRLAAPLAGWVCGLLLAFHEAVLSGLRTLEGGMGDARLINFILEHGYRWLAGSAPHLSFWSPPVFFPHENVAAYTDALVGAAPLYWIWRWLGAGPYTAFGLWSMTVWSLNFVGLYLVLRRYFGTGRLPATLAALVFAFGGARVAQIVHPQLAAQFWLLASFAALLELFREPQAGAPRAAAERLSICVFFAGLVLQAWTAFYAFYFALLLLAAAALWALIGRDTRPRLAARVRERWAVIAAAAAASALALWPLARRYLEVRAERGYFPYSEHLMPRPESWLLAGETSLVWGWVHGLAPFAERTVSAQWSGTGLLTLALAVAGLYRLRRRPAVRLLVLAAASLVVATLLWPGGFSLWRYVRELLPGAAALRALGRVGLMLLLPLAIGLAAYFDGRRAKGLRWTVALALLVIFEQVHVRVPTLDRIELERHVGELAARVDPECRAFLLVMRGQGRYEHLHDDAAWVTLATGVPTVNGRYGSFPPGYLELRRARARGARGMRRVREGLRRWLAAHGASEEGVCLVAVPGADLERSAARVRPPWRTRPGSPKRR